MFLVRPATSAVVVPVRGMATLKDLRLRLRSVTNIQKITKSMKMVSAAKFARAERELRVSKPFGQTTQQFLENTEAKLEPTDDSKQLLIVALTSDRGLCGAVHTNIVRAIRTRLAAVDSGVVDPDVPKTPKDVRLALVGDKARSLLFKQHGRRIVFAANEVGRKPPIFADASAVAEEILEFWRKQGDVSKDATAAVVYNVFRTVVSYRTTTQVLPVPPNSNIAEAPKMTLYDSIDEDTLRSFNEFSLANVLYTAMCEGITSEQSARMSAMDAASKNASEMIQKLTIQMNRTRQAVITRELVEIIAGAAALK